MKWLWKTYSSSLGKKYTMALTGLLLGFFLLAHAAGNSSVFWGREAFNSYAEHLHALGILINIAEVGLLITFLLHSITAILLLVENRNCREKRYAVQKNAGGRSWGSQTMPYTGLIILAFLLLHLGNFHFVAHNKPVFDIVFPVLSTPFYSACYALAMGALGLHLSHGLWSLCQTMGLNHSKYNFFLFSISRIATVVIAGIFFLLLILFMI